MKNILYVRLRSLRKSRKLSQHALADFIGVHRNSIARWELHYDEPFLDNVMLLARFFGVTSDYLLGLSDY